mgnify:CR=1 FL=1
MNQKIYSILIFLLLLTGCDRRDQATVSSHKRVAVTNTYLECAAKDLLDVEILRLSEPGTCPGSFDIRPSQMNDLRACQILLRFDFQRGIDSKLQHEGLKITEIAEVGGPNEPATYLSACREVAQAFVSLRWMKRDQADARLSQIETRLKEKETWVRTEIKRAKLIGCPVITSIHQQKFCQWLGMKVTATFRAADTTSIGEIENAIAAGTTDSAKLVIANLPEGRRTADALGQRLSAKVIVFENFPVQKNGKVSFDQMITANVQSLLATARR